MGISDSMDDSLPLPTTTTTTVTAGASATATANPSSPPTSPRPRSHQLAGILSDTLKELEAYKELYRKEKLRADHFEGLCESLQSVDPSDDPNAPSAAARIIHLERQVQHAYSGRDDEKARRLAISDLWAQLRDYLDRIDMVSRDARLGFDKIVRDGGVSGGGVGGVGGRIGLIDVPRIGDESGRRRRRSGSNENGPPSKRIRRSHSPAMSDRSLDVDEMLLAASSNSRRPPSSHSLSAIHHQPHHSGHHSISPHMHHHSVYSHPQPPVASPVQSRYPADSPPFAHRPAPPSSRSDRPSSSRGNLVPDGSIPGGSHVQYQTHVFAPVQTGAPVKKGKYASTEDTASNPVPIPAPAPPSHPPISSTTSAAQVAGTPLTSVNLAPATSPFPPTNDLGQRICRQCGLPGRYKDGKCVEKWGPGPMGPGTVCDRCRKKMKRVERRGTIEQAQMLAAQQAAQARAQSQSQTQSSQSSQSQSQSQSYASFSAPLDHPHSHNHSTRLHRTDTVLTDTAGREHSRDRERERDRYPHPDASLRGSSLNPPTSTASGTARLVASPAQFASGSKATGSSSRAASRAGSVARSRRGSPAGGVSSRGTGAGNTNTISMPTPPSTSKAASNHVRTVPSRAHSRNGSGGSTTVNGTIPNSSSNMNGSLDPDLDADGEADADADAEGDGEAEGEAEYIDAEVDNEIHATLNDDSDDPRQRGVRNPPPHSRGGGVGRRRAGGGGDDEDDDVEGDLAALVDGTVGPRARRVVGGTHPPRAGGGSSGGGGVDEDMDVDMLEDDVDMAVSALVDETVRSHSRSSRSPSSINVPGSTLSNQNYSSRPSNNGNGSTAPHSHPPSTNSTTSSGSSAPSAQGFSNLTKARKLPPPPFSRASGMSRSGGNGGDAEAEADLDLLEAVDAAEANSVASSVKGDDS